MVEQTTEFTTISLVMLLIKAFSIIATSRF